MQRIIFWRGQLDIGFGFLPNFTFCPLKGGTIPLLEKAYSCYRPVFTLFILGNELFLNLKVQGEKLRNLEGAQAPQKVHP